MLYRILKWEAERLGRRDFPEMRRTAERLGALLWTALPSRRHLAENNISRSLDMEPGRAALLARQSFTENALSFLESALIPRFGFEHPLLEIGDPDLFRRFQQADAPIVATTGHMGAWELEAGLLGEFYVAPRPRMVVVRRYGNPAINRLIQELRGSRGAEVVGHREAVFRVLRALRRKGVAAFLVDHNTSRSEAVFLPFLGRVAAVNMGPALLAVRTGAEVWPTYLLRRNGKYVLHQEPPLDASALQGDRDAKVLAVARFYTAAMERVVHLAPEQWFWMHNRWKTRPASVPQGPTALPDVATNREEQP